MCRDLWLLGVFVLLQEAGRVVVVVGCWGAHGMRAQVHSWGLHWLKQLLLLLLPLLPELLPLLLTAFNAYSYGGLCLCLQRTKGNAARAAGSSSSSSSS